MLHRARGIRALLFCLLAIATPALAAPALTPWGNAATPRLSLRDLEGRTHDLATY